jgi:osmoprotectant transport system substrate-binding protein
MTTRTWFRSMAALIAAALALSAAACGSDNNSGGGGSTGSTTASLPGKGKPAVTIGDKNFTEQYILGELYAQALRKKGYTVTLKPNIGSSEITDKALTSGKIDMYPEYTGTILSELAHQTKPPSGANAAYDQAKAFEEKRGFTMLEKTPFADSDAIAVKQSYAQKNGIESVADLKKVPRFSLGAPPEFRTRFSGVEGMKKQYGLNNIDFKPLSIGLQYKALDSGKVDAANVFTTDGALAQGKYTLLKDPRFIFGFQNVAPVISQKVLDAQGDDFSQTLNDVSAKLSLEAIQKMNAAVDVDKQKPAAVARQFLQANGLV